MKYVAYSLNMLLFGACMHVYKYKLICIFLKTNYVIKPVHKVPKVKGSSFLTKQCFIQQSEKLPRSPTAQPSPLAGCSMIYSLLNEVSCTVYIKGMTLLNVSERVKQ